MSLCGLAVTRGNRLQAYLHVIRALARGIPHAPGNVCIQQANGLRVRRLGKSTKNGGFVISSLSRRALLQASLVVSIPLCVATPACAALGGSPMQTPAGATSATLSPAVAHAAATGSSAAQAGATAPYSVVQTTLASGTVIREYVSSAGVVFGVAWRGPQMPNLATLLGTYQPAFASGVQAAHAAGLRGAGIVNQSDLVVHSGGHTGAFVGQAWLPQALPAGVSGSDIQ
jgi:hypothetical protein